MRLAHLLACTTKAGSAPQFIQGTIQRSDSSYPLSWLKRASSGVACTLSTSFRTSQSTPRRPFAWKIGHNGNHETSVMYTKMRGCSYQYTYRHAGYSLFRPCCCNVLQHAAGNHKLLRICLDSTVFYRAPSTGLPCGLQRSVSMNFSKNSQAWIFDTKVDLCSIPKPCSTTIVTIV